MAFEPTAPSSAVTHDALINTRARAASPPTVVKSTSSLGARATWSRTAPRRAVADATANPWSLLDVQAGSYPIPTSPGLSAAVRMATQEAGLPRERLHEATFTF
jgi:hypothetical protein